MPCLDLSDLAQGFPGITPAVGEGLAQAGGACLESQDHDEGVELRVRGSRTNAYSLRWPEVTEQVIRCFNDPLEATEDGAAGVAILLAKREIGYEVVECSRRGTGFDYWIGDEADLPFEGKARLEVSGIRSGTDSQIRARVRQKLVQIEQSGNFPAGWVIVVEFGRPLAEVREQ